MNTTMRLGAIAALGCLLAACGGGGGNGSDSDAAGPGSAGAAGQPPAGTTTYPATTPVVGRTDAYAITSVDDSDNTTTVGYTQQVASVSGPHSYVLTQADPSNAAPIVNGVDYHFNATTLTYDQGVEVALTDTSETGTVQNCSFVLQSGSHPGPWWVGQAFSYAMQETCTPGDLRSISVSGTVAALEQVTVPAGTFTALRLDVSETWVENGQTVDEKITHWVDPARSFFTIKTVTTFTRSGKVPAHYVTSQTIELQGRTGG